MSQSDTNHWNAEQYEASSFMQRDVIKKVLSRFPLKDHKSVLDIGCGDGHITVKVAKRLLEDSHVTGIDRSEEMILYAQKKYKDLKNLSFKIKDALDVDAENLYDLVISFFCLHWIENQFEVFSKVYRSLQSKGEILFIIPIGKDDASEEIFSLVDSPDWKSYFQNFHVPVHFYKIEEYQTELKKIGFVLGWVDVFPVATPVQDINLFQQFISVLPLFEVFNKTQKQKIIDALTENFVKRCHVKHHGHLIFESNNLVIKAKKP